MSVSDCAHLEPLVLPRASGRFGSAVLIFGMACSGLLMSVFDPAQLDSLTFLQSFA